MEKRHAKVDVCGEVIQKGGRCQSSVSAQGRTSSAVSEKHRLTSSSFRSLKSGQFREVELQVSVEEQPIMKGKVVPEDAYKVLNEVGDNMQAAAYDNEGLELEEGVNHVVISSKLSVSSASSYGLVMEGSRSQRAANGQNVEADSSVTGVSVEGQKYALTDYETTSIIVKEAAAKTSADIIESDVGTNKSASVDKGLVDSTEMKEIRPAQTAEEIEPSENLETAPEEEVTLKRSSTVETNSSVPSTSYTFESSQRPSTSFYDSQRDATLLIGDQDNIIGSSTISQTPTSDPGLPPKRFEVPPGISPASYMTYRLIQKEGFKPGRCMLIIVVFVTFCATMIMAVLILIAPQSFREKTDGSESSLLEGTTPSPGPWSMKSGSLAKGVVALYRIDDTIQRLLAANVSLDDLETNS